MVVDLPAPLRPSSAVACPLSAVRSTPDTASTSPKRTWRSRADDDGGETMGWIHLTAILARRPAPGRTGAQSKEQGVRVEPGARRSGVVVVIRCRRTTHGRRLHHLRAGDLIRHEGRDPARRSSTPATARLVVQLYGVTGNFERGRGPGAGGVRPGGRRAGQTVHERGQPRGVAAHDRDQRRTAAGGASCATARRVQERLASTPGHPPDSSDRVDDHRRRSGRCPRSSATVDRAALPRRPPGRGDRRGARHLRPAPSSRA